VNDNIFEEFDFHGDMPDGSMMIEDALVQVTGQGIPINRKDFDSQDEYELVRDEIPSVIESIANQFEDAHDDCQPVATKDKTPEEIDLLNEQREKLHSQLKAAIDLQKSLHTEISSIRLGRESLLQLTADNDPEKRFRTVAFSIESFNTWFEHRNTGKVINDNSYQWEDIRIELRANEVIRCILPGKKRIEKKTHDIGLAAKNRDKPNKLYEILLRLAQNKKYPTNVNPTGNQKSSISKIRLILRKLVGIDSDPFEKFASDVGYKTRLTLVDRTQAADERAKEKAIHVSNYEYYDETNSNGGLDLGAQWLRENDPGFDDQ